jgi:NADPH-dependent curcumin reductase CurA
MQIVAKRLRIFGLLVGDLEGKYSEEFYRDAIAALKSGKIKYSEDVREGLQATGQGIYDVSICHILHVSGIR